MGRMRTTHLIENEDLAIPHQGPRQRHELPLALTQIASTSCYRRFERKSEGRSCPAGRVANLSEAGRFESVIQLGIIVISEWVLEVGQLIAKAGTPDIPGCIASSRTEGSGDKRQSDVRRHLQQLRGTYGILGDDGYRRPQCMEVDRLGPSSIDDDTTSGRQHP